MKRLLMAIFIMAASCTKSWDVPSSNSVSTESTASNFKKIIPPSTEVYTANYSGISSNDSYVSFSVKFPAFNSAQGILISWRLTLNRKVSGTLTITNSLSVKNDSSIDIDRYTIVGIGGSTIVLPDGIVNRIHQTLPPNRTLKVPIHINVDDEINSTNLTPVIGSATDVLTWNFTDVVDAFKPNCTNSYNLTDNLTITLTYTYKQTFKF